LYGASFASSSSNLTTTPLSGSGLTSNNLTLLKFYEQSYFFYLHRFELTSTLPHLTINSQFKLAALPKNTFTGSKQSTSDLRTPLNYTLQSYTLTNTDFKPYDTFIIPSASTSRVDEARENNFNYSEPILLEARKGYLADRTQVDTLLNLLETFKADIQSAPYFSDMTPSPHLNTQTH
jgi:hypothetical protein